MFYEAVHLVEGYRDGQRRGDSNGHGDRQQYARDTLARQTFQAYMDLDKWSRLARYYDASFNDGQISKAAKAVGEVRQEIAQYDSNCKP